MKIIQTISLCAAMTLSAGSVTAQTLDQQADSAYSADRFEEAAALYRQAMDEYGPSPELYYNLGNSYYRLGAPGKAIVAYERALRIDPTFSDARTNLEFVNSRLADRQGERGSFMSNAFDRLATTLTPNGWAWVAFAIFALCMVCVALYILTDTVIIRKAGFFGGILLLLTSAGAMLTALRARNISRADNMAVIIAPSTILSTSPREPKDRNEEAMLLHEGVKLQILDSISERSDTTGLKWFDVQIDNNHRAWIKSTDVEKI
ncbi:MAG: tetratricopeptide repeat protein [Paramuribaculum sp.]|nr:tetratricopeptide repeat protein [Paramuribaculum sp.]